MHHGLSGDFEIVINPTDTDVSVRYDISLNKEELQNDNIRISDIIETEDNNILTRTGESTYSAVIPLNKIKNGITNTIKISIEWVDNEEESTQDINIGTTSNPELHIPINVHVSQYLGEEISEYIENS